MAGKHAASAAIKSSEGNTTAVVTIHHFEDQVQDVCNLPGGIEAYLLSRYLNVPVSAVRHEENGAQTEHHIYISGGGHLVRIDYFIHQDSGRILRDASKAALILLDVWISDQLDGGVDLYRKLRGKVSDDRLIFLTAYPNKVRDKLGISDKDKRLIVKPADEEALLERIWFAITKSCSAIETALESYAASS